MNRGVDYARNDGWRRAAQRPRAGQRLRAGRRPLALAGQRPRAGRRRRSTSAHHDAPLGSSASQAAASMDQGTSRSCLQVGPAVDNPPASAGDTAAPKATDAADATSFEGGTSTARSGWRALETSASAFPLGVKNTTWPFLSLKTFQPSSWTLLW